MAERPFIFRKDSQELVLPVTPASFQVERGINIEMINIHELGDVVLAGYPTLATVKISCMLPARNYDFADSADDPDHYIEILGKWMTAGEVIRFIVGGTSVNLPCLIQSLIPGEQDGTNDIYMEITLREYKALEIVKITSPEGSKQRSAPENQKSSIQTYKAVYGDTLSGICRKFYGDGSASAYNKLAAYNGKSNPHILMTGEVLKIPIPLP